MSKTIITTKIDGYDIITGFGTLQIEAIETKKVVDPVMAASDEVKAVEAKSKELQSASKQYSDAMKSAREAFKNGNTGLHSKHVYTAGQQEERMKGIQAELVDLIHVAKSKRQEIWNDSIVYHEPKKGEILLEDAVEVKYMELQKGELLTVDGEVVKDNRGVKYVKDGAVQTVTSIGVEPEGPLMEDVTPEQFEEMRLDAMSDKEKADELATVTDGLASQAATMRAKLEIQGDKDALEKAQDWYNAELTIAQEKYATA